MQKQIKLDKGRKNTVQVSLGFDVSADTIASQIRVSPESSSPLLATWQVSFLTDGSDGELILTLDAAVTAAVTRPFGYMDLVRVTGGIPVSVFDGSIQVLFEETVTQVA